MTSGDLAWKSSMWNYCGLGRADAPMDLRACRGETVSPSVRAVWRKVHKPVRRPQALRAVGDLPDVSLHERIRCRAPQTEDRRQTESFAPEIYRWIRPASLKQRIHETVSKVSNRTNEQTYRETYRETSDQRTVSFLPLCNTARHAPGCSAHQGQRRRWKGRKG